ncbi:MAG: transposase [Patescibacteria group bacterium]
MAYRNFKFSVGEYYHLYNRGVDKRSIFVDDHDRNRLAYLMHLSNGDRSFDIQKVFREYEISEIFKIDTGKPLVSICAWVFMDNHFHILAKEIVDGGISRFMKNLCGSYSKYFNIKHDRTGALFEGRFKAQHVDTDIYLKYLFAYIHLNPIKMLAGASHWKEEGIKDLPQAKVFLQCYTYSSLIDFLKPKSRFYDALISKKAAPEYFPGPVSVWREINEWLKFVDVGTPQRSKMNQKQI